MKSKIGILAVSAILASTGFGAVYNVTTGTLSTSNGIAPTGLSENNPSGTALAGTFSGYQAPTTAGIVAYGVFGTFAGPGNTGLFSSLSDSAISAASPATLVSAFQQFGVAGTFNVAGPSASKGVFTRNTSTTVTGSVFSGLNIYAFVGSGSTFANSATNGELLVLKSATLFTNAQDAIPTAQIVTLSTATTTLLYGVNLADVRTTGTDASVTLGWGTVGVPEPSAALLGAIGALGLLRRRRI